MKGVIIIPARLQSSRLPGKLLLDRTGKPLIRHVYDNCKAAVERSDGLLDGPYIATDSKEIIEAAAGPKIPTNSEIIPYSFTNAISYCITQQDHPNGTSRCAEALVHLRCAEALGNLSEPYDFVINVQADEPDLSPDAIKKLTAAMCENNDMATLITKESVDSPRLNDPSTVKVVTDERLRALYFSRCPIGQNDYDRDFYRHIGCYGYKREVLASLTYPAIYEDLEQTLALFMGYQIQCVPVEPYQAGYAINTQQDYYWFVNRYLKEHPECHSHA